MMLQPTTSTRHDANDAVLKVVTLYDAHGKVVGMWSERTGRAMLGDSFYVRELDRIADAMDGGDE